MKIGILGGTFDPPHAGHLGFARSAVEHLKLDEVVFVPANRNPMKAPAGSPGKQRLEMVRLATATEEKIAVSDVELSRGGPSYMVETLMEMQIVRPGDYWLLLGADALRSFDRWKSPQKILKMCRLGIALRPPATEGEVLSRLQTDLRDRIDFVPMKPIDISSSELRDRIARAKGLIAPFLCPSVIQYIKENRLYES